MTLLNQAPDSGRRNEVGVDELYLRYAAPMRRFFIRNMRSGTPLAVIDELVQDVFLRTLSSGGGQVVFEDNRALNSWIYTIAKNILIDAMRRKKTRDKFLKEDEVVVPESHPNAMSMEELIIQREQIALIVRRVLELPEEQKQAFLMRVEGEPFLIIGDRQGVSESTAKSRHRYAMAKIREALGDAE